MTIEELGNVIADFIRVGYDTAVADYDPPQDVLRASEVKKWLRFRHLDIKVFKDFENLGLIKARRGSAKNSPLLYSKKEIVRVFATQKLIKLFDYGKS